MRIYLKSRHDPDPGHIVTYEYHYSPEKWSDLNVFKAEGDYVVIGLVEVISEVIFRGERNMDFETPRQAVANFIALARPAGFCFETAFDERGQLSKGVWLVLIHETEGREAELEALAKRAVEGLRIKEIEWSHHWERPVLPPLEEALEWMGVNSFQNDAETLKLLGPRLPDLIRESWEHLYLLVIPPFPL